MEEIELSLNKFLEAKPLYYNEIDYTRMPRAYESIKERLHIPKIIHIMGTNGKGTTGRFLASALKHAGFSVGHYSSPHILEFNERIWLNGKNVDIATLEDAHNKLQNLLSDDFLETLSYFEYTTFLAMIVYASCEYIVLEAGLGGEYDATSVFESILSIYTPIDMDHEAFLGDSIEAVATTKLNAMGERVLLASQRHKIVNEFAIGISKSYNSKIYFVTDVLKNDDNIVINEVSKRLGLVNYLQDNLQTALCALKLLDINYTSFSFDNAKLFGRLMQVRKNVTVDVGHNALAALAIKEAYYPKKVVLVYNSFADKNYAEVLSILKEIILHVEVLHVEDSRIVDRDDLNTVLDSLEIVYKEFETVDDKYEYLVFGSFSVAEVFLKAVDEKQIYNNTT